MDLMLLPATEETEQLLSLTLLIHILPLLAFGATLHDNDDRAEP